MKGAFVVKKQWSLIGILVLVLVIVLFSWMNGQSVTVNFGFAQVTMPLVVILVVSVLVGVVIAVLFSMTTILQQRSEIKQLNHKLQANQKMKRTVKTTPKDATKKQN
ncbi:hypothetical protein FC32_GL000947 [Ligilactobacillus apodemi DSM 16634 = JCM 16172]|uniref:Lipopolysaccharide assembly protein A domain-containing protein n=1 Tax=Ligilactobacillus apodemi DSM 16634 = JCM 16172 TaxID=1423724 RepID=A0A0R1TQG7_9LACO|nr:hypothetical protein FC32_GL000947 [Ligilactobacillus apodemi DSM 16634 = JCM 16172]